MMYHLRVARRMRLVTCANKVTFERNPTLPTRVDEQFHGAIGEIVVEETALLRRIAKLAGDPLVMDLLREKRPIPCHADVCDPRSERVEALISAVEAWEGGGL